MDSEQDAPEWVKLKGTHIDSREAAIDMMTAFEGLPEGSLVKLGHGTDSLGSMPVVMVRLAGETWVFSIQNALHIADIIATVAESHPDRYTVGMHEFREGLIEVANMSEGLFAGQRTLQ